MEKILLVDDDAVSLAICKAILSQHYDTMTARSGLQAMGSLQAGALPNLIISDIYMPGLDGLGLLDQLKAMERTRNIPVILSTAMSDLDVAKEGYLRGAAELIVKPVIPEALMKKVELILEWSRLRKENEELRRELQEMKKLRSERSITDD